MLERVTEIISDLLEADASQIREDTLILEDLGANSLDVIEIIAEIEDTFAIAVPDEDIPNFKTVGDLVSYIDARNTGII